MSNEVEMQALIEQLMKKLGIVDEELLETVVEHAMLVLSEECSMPDKRSIRETFDGLSLKFRVHGFPGLADQVDAGVMGLVGDRGASYMSTPDLPWNLLKLLLPLSWQPMQRAQSLALNKAEPTNHGEVSSDSTGVEFDWAEHLMEGGWEVGGEESDGDWSQLSDDEEEEDSPSSSEQGLPPSSQASQRALTIADRITSSTGTFKSTQAQIPSRLPSSTAHTATTSSLSLATSSRSSTVRSAIAVPPTFKYSDPFASCSDIMRLRRPADQVLFGQKQPVPPPVNDSISDESTEAPVHTTSQMEILLCCREGYDAEQRLKNVVQDCEWFTASHLTARPGKPDTLSLEKRVTVLTEYQVMREVLWMFLAPVSMRCFGLDGDLMFQPRPDFTVKDVGPEVLWQFLHRLCPYYDALRMLREFNDDLYDGCSDGATPPGTYRAYASAVERHLAAFRQTVADVMARVAKQESINTLISLSRELQPSLDTLQFIADVHRRVTCRWREKPYWLSSVRLLSVLYQMLLEEWTPSRGAILLDLFVRSFYTYARIIDLALTQGRLVDPLGEFVVYSDSNVDSSMYDSWENGFYVQPYAEYLHRDAGIPPLQMLDNITGEILVCCKTMHLVNKLEKLRYMPDRSQEKSMYNAFLQNLEAEFSKYVTPEELPALPEHEKKEEFEPVFNWTGKTNPMTVHLKNPLLRDVFREFIEFEDNQDMTAKPDPWESTVDDDCDRLKRCATNVLLPYCVVLCQVLKALVDEKYHSLGAAMNVIMEKDVRLSYHLKMMRSVFLLETGDIVGVFNDSLMQKEKDEPYWQYSHYLTDHLEEYFKSSFPGLNRFQVMVGEKFLQDNVFEAIDGIILNYKTEWPMSLIVSRHNRSLYNEIFRQLLKQKLALSSLERLRFIDLAPTDAKQARRASVKARMARWHLLRFQLMNALSAIHNFTMSHVVHLLSARFDEQIRAADDFDYVVGAHNRYVRAVHRMCLDPFDDPTLKTSLESLVRMSQSVVSFWSQGSFVVLDDRLAGLEHTYCVMHMGICDALVDYNPKESGIQIESLLSVFSYPLNQRYQDITRHSGVV